MNRFNRFLTTTFLSVAMLLPSAAQAVGFTQFDGGLLWNFSDGRGAAVKFTRFDEIYTEVQSEYVAIMLDETENALIREGNSAAAEKMENLFTTVLPGDHHAIGLVEYVRNEARARVFDAKRAAKDPKARRLDVEDALFVTLKKNNIVPSDKSLNDIVAAMAHFQPQTFGKFEAKTSAEQRHYIALLVKFARPDFEMREMVSAELKGKKDVYSGPMDLEQEVIQKEFPLHSADQPGFVPVAEAIKSEGVNHPDAPGVFGQLLLYILEAAEAQSARNIQVLDANAILLPDGRHVYVGDNDELWAEQAPGQGSLSATRLTGKDRELAARLRECMHAHNIVNGKKGLAVCRAELGLDAAPTPAPAVDNQSMTPDDNPLGEGGYIRPFQPSP